MENVYSLLVIAQEGLEEWIYTMSISKTVVFLTPLIWVQISTQKGMRFFPYAYSEKQLFFSSNGREGIGNLDLFLAEHVIEKRWETFILGKDINTKEDDFSFGIKEDLSMGYFSSDRAGGEGADDIYTFPFTPEIAGLTDHYVYVPSDTLIVANNGVLKNDIKMLQDKDPLQRLLEKEAVSLLSPHKRDRFFSIEMDLSCIKIINRLPRKILLLTA